MNKRSLFLPASLAVLVAVYIAWAPLDSRESAAPRTAVQVGEGTSGAAAKGAGADSSIAADTPVSTADQPMERDCSIVTHHLPNDDGTTSEAYSCEPVEDRAGHPYESYPSEALASLAYADAKAAEILAMRLREEDEEAAMSLVLRASALSGGDVEPILAWSNAYPQPTAIDGVPVRKTIHVKFVLSAVAELLGAETNNLPYWEEQIRRASTDPDREIVLLHERARRILDEMRQIQLDVTGSSTFGGQNDA